MAPAASSEPRFPGPFTIFLAVSTVALGILCLLLALENRRLKAQPIPRAMTAAGIDPIRAGDLVAPLSLIHADGSQTMLALSGPAPTLVLIFSSGCGHCEQVVSAWEALVSDLGLAGSGPDAWATVVALQSDARAAADLRPISPLIPTALADNPGATWLRRVPLEPAAILIGPGGTILGDWIGLPPAADTNAIRNGLLTAAANADGAR